MQKLFSALIFITILACSSQERGKPSDVPKEAIWKGGVDGGCWILFSKVSENNIEATIFYENGEVWVKGTFKKQGNCQISKDILVKKIEGFDGESLITNERCLFKK